MNVRVHTIMALHLIFDIIVVINAIKSFWKTVDALVPGVVNMDEWFNLFHAIKVVKDPAS